MRRLLVFIAAALLAAPAPAALKPQVSVISTSVDEGTPATVRATRTGDLSRSSSVIFSTSNATAASGTNYTARSGTLTFAPGSSLSSSAQVPTIHDLAVTPNLYFVVRLGVVSNAIIQANGTVTVRNVDQPPPPPPVQCPDGTTVPAGQTCPTPSPTPAPVPPPTGTDNPLTGQSPGVGAPDIATTDHDINNDLQPSWGTGAIPPKEAVIGALRFLCRHTTLAFDDPTVYPGQPGKSHLHDQTGVYGWNAFSNYGNLRTGGGGSGCNDVAGADKNPAEVNWSANRTPYWQPALLDGKGNVLLADYTSFYYKARPYAGPLADPIVTDPTNPQYEGKGVPLPNGIKFIFGSNVSAMTATNFRFSCTLPTSNTDYPTMAEAIQCVKANSAAGAQLEVHQDAPGCWDGINLDTADHRSHLAYPSYGWWGYQKCDDQHPYVIPTFTYAVFYTILPSDDGDIHFSSDEMDNSKPRGWSFHVDYGPQSWDPTVLKMWLDGCINQSLDCSGGDLGNGKQLKGASQPIYYDPATGTYTQSWRNPVRLVPIPPPSTN